MTTQQLRDDFRAFTRKNIFSSISIDVYTDYWLDRMKEQEEELIKAFGGCKNCYGKGYYTNLDNVAGSYDFGDEIPYAQPTPYYNPCTCARGVQFKKSQEELVKKCAEIAYGYVNVLLSGASEGLDKDLSKSAKMVAGHEIALQIESLLGKQ